MHSYLFRILASILAKYIVIMHRYFHKLFAGSMTTSTGRFCIIWKYESFTGFFSSFCHFSIHWIQVQTCWTWWLQVIENVLWSKFCIYLFFQASTNEIGQFVSIPTSKSKLFMKLQKMDFLKNWSNHNFWFFLNFTHLQGAGTRTVPGQL